MRAGIVTLARIIGRRYGVTVVVDPNIGTAATNGKVIYIPPIDLSLNEDVELLDGLIDHEAMHCRLTDFDVSGDNGPEQALLNVFEDVWGELDFAKIYPGTRRSIKRAAEIMVNRGVIGGKCAEDAHPAQLVGSVLVNGLRSQILGQDCLQEAYLHNLELLKLAVGEPLTQKIWETSMKVRDIHSTSDALDLTREVLALMKDEQEQQQEQQSQQQAGDDEPDDSEPDQGKPESSGSGDPGEDDSKDDDQIPGDEKGDEGQGDAQPGNGDGEPGGPVQSEPEVGSGSGIADDKAKKVDPDQLAETLKAIENILSASEEDFGKTDLADIVEGVLPERADTDYSAPAEERPTPSPGWDSSITPTVRVLRNTLAARLTHLFDAQEETRVWMDKSGRKLDRKSMSKIPTGEKYVFRKLEYGDAVSVEVSLVIDCSLSMGNNLSSSISRMQAAQAVSLALGDVLDMHDIPFSVTLFGDSLCVYKGTDQSWKSAKQCPVELVNDKNTRTGWAVLEGSKDIIFSDRDRRIMLVITDGMPDDFDFAVSESAEIQKTGVEVRYVMIGGDFQRLASALGDVGVYSSVAGSVDGLASAVFDAVEPKLARRLAA